MPHGGKYLTLKYKYKYKYSGHKYEYECKYLKQYSSITRVQVQVLSTTSLRITYIALVQTLNHAQSINYGCSAYKFISCIGVGAVLEFEQQLLTDLRRYATAVQRLFITVINSLLVVVITAATTRLISCILSRSRDLHHVVDTRQSADTDVVSATQPATVSVNAQTRNFTVFDLRFSETKV